MTKVDPEALTMALPGAFTDKSIIMPRWLMVLSTAIIAIFSAGIGVGANYVTAKHKNENEHATLLSLTAALAKADTVTSDRVDHFMVADSLRWKSMEGDHALIQAMARLTCLEDRQRDGRGWTLAEAAGLPCGTLISQYYHSRSGGVQ